MNVENERLTMGRKPNKLERLNQQYKEIQKEISELKGTKKKKKKKFKLPFKFKQLQRQSQKKPEYVVVQYLTIKQQVEFKLCKIVSGDVVSINNKAYVLDPKTVWRHKKYLWYIIREIDRKPVSNMDYDKVKARKDDTDADVPLVKMVLGAVEKNRSPLKNPNIIYWIIGAIVLAIVAFAFLGGK